MKNILLVLMGAAIGVPAIAGSVQVAPDFFVDSSILADPATYAADLAVKNAIDPKTTDCRAVIEPRMCLVDPPADPSDFPSWITRPCLPGGEAYAKPFEAIYDHIPPTFQKMFCSIKKIYVEKQFYATAYASIHPSGVFMGIRQSVLDQSLEFAQWASWKEQLAFGGNQGTYDPTPGLPYFDVAPIPGVNGFLYQLVIHEFGHQFDFANQLNRRVQGCPAPTPEVPRPDCAFEPGTWGQLSWTDTNHPLPQNEFAGRRGFCFYGCTRTTPTSDVTTMYSGLWNSSFINAYAATGAYDDFADSLAYYAFHYYLGGSITLDSAQGARYDLTKKLRSARFQAKHDFIDAFLARPDIVYP